jgi:hypothetical protein
LRAARRASGGAWWRSPASGARPKTRQRTGGRSGLLWPGQDLGLRAGSGCRWRGQCRAVLGGDRLASGARPKTRQRTGGRSGLLWPGQDLGLRAGSGCRWRGQCRAVLGSDRPASGARSKTRQRTGSRSGLLWPGQDLGLLAVVLSYRQFVRVFVLSIGEACREATTAPVSGGAWWRSAGKRCQVECETTHWRPAGLAVVCRSGPRVAGSKASVVQCSVTIAGKRCQRSKARRRTGGRSGLPWPVVRVSGCGQQGERRAVLGGDRPASGARSKTRQRTGNRSGLPWSGQDLGLRSARRASCSAWWRSPASGARPKTRQRTGGRSGLPWPGQGVGLRAGSGCRWRGQCRAVLGGDRLASGARSKARQRTGSQSGLPWPGQGVGLLAVVLSYRQFVRVFVLSIDEACREATTAPASCSAR